MKKKNDSFLNYFLWFASIVWILYSLIISFGSGCSLEMEQRKDGWYVYYEVQDPNEIGYADGYNKTHEGPITKSEATQIIKNCVNEAESFNNKYGTIYSFVPRSFFLSLILTIIYFFSPFILYYIYCKSTKKESALTYIVDEFWNLLYGKRSG